MFDASVVFFPVADLAAAVGFYEGVLSLKLVVDQGGIKIYQVAGGGFVGLCQSDTPPIADDRLIITFVTDDVDGCHARLSAAGVPTDGPPRENPRYQIYHFFARDPAGYRVEVQRFLHPFP